MALTNATVAKAAFFDLLIANTGAAQVLDGVTVLYAWGGQGETKLIYGGGWRATMERTTAELPNLVQELVEISFYIRVTWRPACPVVETDVMADQIASAVGGLLKANPRLAGALTWLGISRGQGDYEQSSTETTSVHSYAAQFGAMVSW